MNICLKTTPLQQAMVRNRYKSFVRSCIGNNYELTNVKSEFIRLNNVCKQNGLHQNFCDATEKLYKYLIEHNNTKLSNIILGELGKIYARTGNFTHAEDTLIKSLMISKSMDDNIHVLARLTDLEFLYKDFGDKKKLYRTLKEKIKYAKEILENYEQNASKFNTLTKSPTSKNSIKIQLAYAYTNLADLLIRKHPQDSLKLVEKAKQIYMELAKTKEIKYLNVKQDIIKSYTYRA